MFKKQQTEGKQNGELIIEKISINNSLINYNDYSRKEPLSAGFSTKSLNANTEFKKGEVDFKTDGDFKLITLTTNGIQLPKNQPYTLDMNLSYQFKERILTISSGKLNHSKFGFENLQGIISLNESPALDIKCSVDNFSYVNLPLIVPETYLKPYKDYKIKASGKVTIDIKGLIDNLKDHTLAIEVALDDFSAFYPEKNITVTKHQLKGSIRKLKGTAYDKVIISNLTGRGLIEEDPIQYDITAIKNKGANLTGVFTGEFSGENISKLNPDIPVQNLKGQFKYSVNIKKESSHIKADGEVEVIKTSFINKDFPLPVSELNAMVVFNNSELAFQNLDALLGDNEISFSGIIINPLNLKTPDKPFFIEGNLTSSSLKLDELMGVSVAVNSDNPSSSSKVRDYTIPKTVNLKLDVAVNNVSYKRFNGQKIIGKVTIKDSRITSEGFSFESIGGKINGAFTAFPENGFIHALIKGKVSNVSADSIFYVFENFDQDFIENKHLKGQISATINSDLFLTRNLAPIPKTIKSYIDASIINGELVNFPPMQRLSKFVDEKQLAQLSFSKLTNKITIENSKISIPEMLIESNVSNIELSGWHTLDQRLEYHLKVPLRKKYKKDKDERFGVIDDPEKNVSNLFLKIAGTTSDYKFSYDQKAVLNKMKEDIKREGRDVIKIFQSKGKSKNSQTKLNEDEFFDFSEEAVIKKDTTKSNQ